jgi:hypothetical protein
MISKQSGEDRVNYVGIAETGLLNRFMNGPTIKEQDNNWIGDCISTECPRAYTWRAKSAELRRREIYKVMWAILSPMELPKVERELILYKLNEIKRKTGVTFKDPANSRYKKA